MRLVIDNVKSEHFKWLTEMAKTLKFRVVEVELSENEEDAYLLEAMEEVKDEPVMTKAETADFKKWLTAED